MFVPIRLRDRGVLGCTLDAREHHPGAEPQTGRSCRIPGHRRREERVAGAGHGIGDVCISTRTHARVDRAIVDSDRAVDLRVDRRRRRLDAEDLGTPGTQQQQAVPGRHSHPSIARDRAFQRRFSGPRDVMGPEGRLPLLERVRRAGGHEHVGASLAGGERCGTEPVDGERAPVGSDEPAELGASDRTDRGLAVHADVTIRECEQLVMCHVEGSDRARGLDERDSGIDRLSCGMKRAQAAADVGGVIRTTWVATNPFGASVVLHRAVCVRVGGRHRVRVDCGGVDGDLARFKLVLEQEASSPLDGVAELTYGPGSIRCMPRHRLVPCERVGSQMPLCGSARGDGLLVRGA